MSPGVSETCVQSFGKSKEIPYLATLVRVLAATVAEYMKALESRKVQAPNSATSPNLSRRRSLRMFPSTLLLIVARMHDTGSSTPAGPNGVIGDHAVCHNPPERPRLHAWNGGISVTLFSPSGRCLSSPLRARLGRGARYVAPTDRLLTGEYESGLLRLEYPLAVLRLVVTENGRVVDRDGEKAVGVV